MSGPKRKTALQARVGRAWDKLRSLPPEGGIFTRLGSPSRPPSQTSQLSLSRTGHASEPNLHLPKETSSPALYTPGIQRTPSELLLHSGGQGATKHFPSGLDGSSVWRGLQTTLRGLRESAGLFPPLQSAIDGLVSCVSTIQESGRNLKEYQIITQELQGLSESLDQHLRASSSTRMSDSIVRTARSIQDQVDLIEGNQGRSAGRRLIEVDRDHEIILSYYRHIEGMFRQLEVEARLSIWSIVNEQLVNTRLEGMNPVMLAAYNSILSIEINRRGCTQNTRIQILSELRDWSTDPDSPNIYWINGLAGTGKTTIAYTFATLLEERKQLAASFFCTRTNDECCDVNRIVPTIAYQLARYSLPFQAALCQSLEKDPDAGSRMISTQFLRLLKEPLLEVKAALPTGLVVVIDALDECKLSKGVEVVLDLLLQNASDLPIKFFVASRPAPNIRDKIETKPEGSRTIQALHDIEQSFVQADIELYLQEQLPSLTAPLVKQLATLSGFLFIFAATTARYIQAGEEIGDLDEHLDAVLSITSGANEKHIELDELYTTILIAADKKMLEKGAKERMRNVLWTVVCVREPVTIETLTLLAGISDSKKTQSMLRQLHSVLHSSGQGDTVSILHVSFAEFILNQSRSGPFFCDVSQHSWLLARQCFSWMKQQLRFNICGLESSHILDERVPDLGERVNKAIPSTLAYTCRYWGDHLQQACSSNGLYDLIEEFLSERLLFWMEAMNLKRWMGVGLRVIIAAKAWLTINHPLSEVLKFAEDTRKFVAAFAANPVCQSTPHLYVSALPLCHRSSSVYKHYWKRTRGLIEPKGAGIEDRHENVLSAWRVDSPVFSISHSPNGDYLAVGCRDGSLIVKNTYDGASVEVPFSGHSKVVRSAAFSPDGMRIVSGSEDHTVCIWDLAEGTQVGAPLLGHAGAVMSVAYSPDGTHIASGSSDCTVRVWDAKDGTSARAPFQGHNNSVMAVVYCPDGKHIASGSVDCTVRIWDVRHGTLVGAVFEGHTKMVMSLAYSRDGRRLASGSHDCTIRVWDVQNSVPIGAPFCGHGSWVTSVAFSPDGTTIVSGSYDRTLRLWSTLDGTPIGNPLRGHFKGIWSVAFSPDGTRIVSGSQDSTIRTWDAQTSTLVDTYSKGSPNNVLSVAFSPDGKLVASGCNQGIVRIWDARNGSLHGTPLEGHTGLVLSVAFSLDSTRVVSGSDDCSICVWNVQQGYLIRDPIKGRGGQVLCMAVSPDCTRVVSGSQDCTVRVWDLQEGVLSGTTLEGHADRVTSVAFSPDGARIVSGSSDKTIRIWDVGTGSLIGTPFDGHSSFVMSLAFSPDGTRLVSGSIDNQILVWNSQNGTLALPSIDSPSEWVTSVACSFDNAQIVSGFQDGMIYLSSMEDGTLIRPPLYGHSLRVGSVAFSPHSRAFVSGSRDRSVRMWDVYSNDSTIDTWTTGKDGWVLGDNQKLLFWLPPDLALCLPTPYNRWSVGPHGPIQVDYSKVMLGDSWQGCYHDRSV